LFLPLVIPFLLFKEDKPLFFELPLSPFLFPAFDLFDPFPPTPDPREFTEPLPPILPFPDPRGLPEPLPPIPFFLINNYLYLT
jgi:hypothetical protein